MAETCIYRSILLNIQLETYQVLFSTNNTIPVKKLVIERLWLFFQITHLLKHQEDNVIDNNTKKEPEHYQTEADSIYYETLL